ncbi:TR11B factor, partial [Amia calva]|nr:TR11B factor [Amia calva]
PTYQHQDPVTGKMLSCDHCPPGTHLHSHCTATRQTVCAPCPASHYTQYWNYLYSCQYCNNFCNENQFVKKECSALHNRICECREGYFWDSEFCLKHTECPSGYGIKVKGTAYKDTLCEKCPSGYFSSKTLGHLSCVKHTNCTTLGLKQVLQGTAWHNSLCVPCNDLEAQGTFYYFFRTTLSSLPSLCSGYLTTLLSLLQ